MKPSVNLFWFRRDLRMDDNAGLYHALKLRQPLVPVFIFDRNILDELDDKDDKRVSFIYESLKHMQDELVEWGSSLDVRYGFPEEVFNALLKDYQIGKVFTNGDYEPYATERDRKIETFLRKKNITFHSYKDQVIFEKEEVVKDDGTPYTVFTPYARKWKATLTNFYLKQYPCKKYYEHFYKQAALPFPILSEMSFNFTNTKFPSANPAAEKMKTYDKTRDFPGIAGTTRLSVHLRFGTISIRKLAKRAGELNETFLNELIWREFYQCILWHFPQIVTHSFKPEYDNIKWRNNEKEFKAWCAGNTGYPIVDAGMRELNETGFMHNRVRMITASFLTKHLLIDWRWGEAYFGKKLLDYDLAANNGGWQWSAGTGCDAAPYFRVFNPYLQTKKFDPELTYIRKWVPEFEELTYPQPIVEHEFARKRCLEAYKKALNQK